MSDPGPGVGGMDAPSSMGGTGVAPCLADFDWAGAAALTTGVLAELAGLAAAGVPEVPLFTSPGLVTPAPGLSVEPGVGACLWLLLAGSVWRPLGVCGREETGAKGSGTSAPGTGK